MKYFYKWLLFGFLITANFKSFGQIQNDQKKFRLGIKTGINISFFHSRIAAFGEDKNSNPFIRPSLTIGLIGKTRINDNLSLTTEFAWSGKGGAFRQPANDIITISSHGAEDSYYYQEFQLNYFELPAIIEINPEIFDRKFSFGLGLSPMFNSNSMIKYNCYESAQASIDFGFVDVDEKAKKIEFDYANKFNCSWIIDACFEKGEGKIKGLFGFRYSQTFFDVYSVGSLDGYNMKTKMSSISLNIGFRF